MELAPLDAFVLFMENSMYFKPFLQDRSQAMMKVLTFAEIFVRYKNVEPGCSDTSSNKEIQLLDSYDKFIQIK